MPSMQSLITRILDTYPHARASTAFGGPHEIQKMFQELRSEISNLDFIQNNPNLVVKSSYGKGNWAAVPWLAILDSRETDTTQDGTYVVFLFREDGKGCHLKLAQGVTQLKNIMGSVAASKELKRRADEIRSEFPEMETSGFDLTGSARLDTENSLAKLYESSSIFSKYWSKDAIPNDNLISADLKVLLTVYESYVSNNLKITDLEPTNQLTDHKIWAIAAGENGRLWDDFREHSIVAIGSDSLGDLSLFNNQIDITNELSRQYPDGRRPTNDSLCCFQFSKEMKVGDIVLAKSGRKRIFGAGVIESDYIHESSRTEYKNIRKVKWLKIEPSELPGTGTATKALTDITPYPTFVSFVHTYLGDENNTNLAYEKSDASEDYSIQNIIADGCFHDVYSLEKFIDRLRLKKNIILQGPPGTGKTWLAKRLAYALMGQKDHSRLRSVQFHPNLSYEDFVRGWRPTGDGKLSLVDGAFMEAVEDARNTSRPFVIVIEEINRGNPAQIFGEMLTLLEADKRYPDEALELCYRKTPGERVFIPSNLFVIGTMNVADRSLALVDMALRRRFAFIDLEPQLNDSWKNWLVNQAGLPVSLVKQIEEKISNLNQVIASDPTLGPQYRIGHSYVTPPLDGVLTDPKEWFKQVVETEIGPLLNEYWFDSADKALDAQRELLVGL